MTIPSRLRRRPFALLLAATAVCGASFSPTAALAAPRALTVEVLPDTPEIDATALSEAVANELAGPDEEAPTPLKVVVSVDHQTEELVVEMRNKGLRISRRVPAPADPTELRRIAVFLIGNLARGQASPLPQGLRPPTEPPAEDPTVGGRDVSGAPDIRPTRGDSVQGGLQPGWSAHLDTILYDANDPAIPTVARAWRVGGPGFASAGGGLRLAVTRSAAVLLGPRLSAAFGAGGGPTGRGSMDSALMALHLTVPARESAATPRAATRAVDGGDQASLIDALRRGDSKALGVAYDHHHAPVRAFARRLLADEASAEDVVQETFVALPGAIRSFRGDAVLRTFLLGMVVNHARHHARAAARRRAALERMTSEPVVAAGASPESDGGAMSHDDDILARATRRFREETGAPSPDAERSRARILLRASTARRRPKRLLWIAPIAAALAASTAWAATHGGLPGAWREVRSLLSAPRETDRRGTGADGPRGLADRAGETASPTPATGSARGEVSAVPEATFDSLPMAAVPLDSLPLVPTSPLAPAQTSEVIPPASPAPEGGTEATRFYAVAHEAHFVTRDPNAALATWDAYLRAAPDGPLAPEARYNRALTLIRLGRKDEAREALTPFARGEVEGYRQGEARELLEALVKP